MENLSSVGRISKLFGAKGELVLTLFTTFPADFNKKEPLFVIIDGLAVPLFMSRFERRGRTGAVVAFDDIDSTVRAEELIGMEIKLPEPEASVDEDSSTIQMSDLVGFTAIINGDRRGIIQDYIDNKLNPLFVVILDNVEVLIPDNDDFISGVNLDSQEFFFELPEGLLDLNQ